jgi:ribosomal protein S18 acetylase RimI-like enzyme
MTEDPQAATRPPFTVRQAGLSDVPVLRTLRLAALTEAPEAFSSTLERETRRTTEDWHRWLAPGATFLLMDGADDPRGLVAAVPGPDVDTVWLMAMWLHPALRRSGAADALVRALVNWAAATGARRVRLEVRASNARARRFYERMGFAFDADGPRWPESACELTMALSLR